MSDPFDFYESIAPFRDFAEVGEARHYRAAPDDWLVAVSDVVRSTEALRAGRYKEVNMAGAAVIAAAMNTLGRRRFPFAFGGDGAVFAAPGAFGDDLARSLAAVRDWAAQALGLTLRVAMAPTANLRAAGRDVRIARFAASDHVDYAMFDGGGAAWLESEMKAGRTPPLISRPRSKLDLTGLSCRWAPMDSRNGVILSLIAAPAGRDAATGAGFREVMRNVLALFEAEENGVSPVSPDGVRLTLADAAFRLEALATAPGGDIAAVMSATRRQTMIAKVLMATGLPLGGFRPNRYRRELAENSDVRKFDDGLKMTADCSTDLADRVEAALTEAERAGLCRFGTHRQDKAIMTCLVPDHTRSDHMHFVDGASGGYAVAAARMKEKHPADEYGRTAV